MLELEITHAAENIMDKYFDRYEAGKVLAEYLNNYTNKPNTIVLALPRGGVPVAYEVAKALSIPLDIFIVRKLGTPNHEELAMGAIATGGILVFNDDIIQELDIPKKQIDEVIRRESQELNRRNKKYRGNRTFPDIEGKTIILVDDGIATGATIKAAIKALRLQHPASIIVAVPVAAISTCEEIASTVDKIICPLAPKHFNAVGAWYENFSQTEDEEVHELLAKTTNFLTKK
jgi:putative phosphoribosyl transferase